MADGDVLAGVDVGAVGAGALGFVGDFEAGVFDEGVGDAVEVEVPEGGVFEGDVGDCDVVGVLDEEEARRGTSRFLVLGSALRWSQKACQKGRAAVEGAGAGDVEVVAVVGVEEARRARFRSGLRCGCGFWGSRRRRWSL